MPSASSRNADTSTADDLSPEEAAEVPRLVDESDDEDSDATPTGTPRPPTPPGRVQFVENPMPGASTKADPASLVGFLK